jgi:hypothetical protein
MVRAELHNRSLSEFFDFSQPRRIVKHGPWKKASWQSRTLPRASRRQKRSDHDTAYNPCTYRFTALIAVHKSLRLTRINPG